MVVCDRSGFTVWASETRREWNGLVVHKSQYEARHPQDFLRARRENFRVDPARPQRSIADEPSVGPISTEIVAAVGGPDNTRVAPMGALGEYTLGQTEDDNFGFVALNAAGAQGIQVESTAGMTVGDRIGIMLDNNENYQTTIFAVVGPIRLLLDGVLPASASPGNLVFDYTAST